MDKRKLTSFSMVCSNELILKNIFKFLPLRDLKIIRLISRLWRTISCPIFQRKAVVQLNENVHLETSVMDRFLTAFAITPKRLVVFRHYKFNLFNFDFDSEDVMEAFWEKFGSSIEHLELYNVRVVGVEMVRDVLFNICPNLKSICIKDCSFYDTVEGGHASLAFHETIAPLDENVKMNKNMTSIRFSGGEKQSTLPINWEEIFIAYPNLNSLSFYNVSSADTNAIMEIVKSLKLKTPNSIQLQKLNIFNGDYAVGEIQPHIMDRFLSLQFSLKELSIDLGATVNYQKVAQLLHQQRNVESLIIYRGPLGTPMKQFPFGVQFNNLRYLEITETVSDCMGFLQFMPNLTTLALCEPPEVEPPFLPIDVIAKTDINFTQMPLQTKLSTLKIEYDISTSDVRKLVFWFPGVTRAKLYLDNESFRYVCGEWRKLEELEVLGEKLTTEGITGIIEPKVKNPRTQSDHVPERQYNPLNITCLTNLRQFIMINYKMSAAIDDLCVDEGFMKLPHLNYLEICTRDVTNDGWTKLFNWKQLKTLKPSDGKWNSGCDAFKKSLS